MPSFNHDRADGFYCPCDICWKEMKEEDKANSVLGRVKNPQKTQLLLETEKPLGRVLDVIRAELEREGL